MVLHGSRWVARRAGKGMTVGLQTRDELNQYCLITAYEFHGLRKFGEDWTLSFQRGRLGERGAAVIFNVSHIDQNAILIYYILYL